LTTRVAALVGVACMQPGDPSISDWNAHASAAPQPSRGSASSALRPAGSWLRGCPMGQQGAPEAIGVAPESSSSMAREQRTLNRLIHLEEGARSGPLLRRLVFRLRITWFLLRRTPRAKMLRRLGLLGFILRTAAAWLLLVLVPAQLAFELSVAFNWAYAVGYALDAVLLTPRLASLSLWSARLGRWLLWQVLLALKLGDLQSVRRLDELLGGAAGSPPASPGKAAGRLCSRSCDVSTLRRASPGGIGSLGGRAPPSLPRLSLRKLVVALLVAPYDLVLWNTSAQNAVPWVRVLRAIAHWNDMIDAAGYLLERSPKLSFAFARVLRIINFFVLSAHWLGCAIFLACRSPAASHYAASTEHFRQFNAQGEESAVGKSNVINFPRLA